jgi:hypothetical protein
VPRYSRKISPGWDGLYIVIVILRSRLRQLPFLLEIVSPQFSLRPNICQNR